MCLGANTSSYSILSIAIKHRGRYYCQVENQNGITNSDTATVIVTSAPMARHFSVISEVNYSKDIPTKQKSENVSQIKDFTPSADLES